MPGEKNQQIKSVLSCLATAPSIESSVLVRVDGILVESTLPQEVNSKAVAAMVATLVGTAETSSRELGKGVFRQVIIESGKGKTIALKIGGDFILGCLAKPQANLGLVLIEMNRAAENLGGVLG